MAKQNDPQLFSSGYERNRLDRYWTNPWMTYELFRNVDVHYPVIGDRVWECAAGRGDMSKAIAEHDRLVYSTDVDMSEFDSHPDILSGHHERSFLEEFELPLIGGEPVDAIITNPPYSEPWRGIADDFIKHGLMFMETDSLDFMAMLLRSEFCNGKSRSGMFGKCGHYMGELVLTTRPRWDYGDPDAPENAAPRHNFSWFLWSLDYQKHNDPIQLFSYMPKGFKP